MAETRNISLNANAVDMTTVRATVGQEQLYRAIGYLSTWNMTYDTCGISVYPEDAQIVACYTRSNSADRYVIVAVWDATAQTYSFHS